MNMWIFGVAAFGMLIALMFGLFISFFSRSGVRISRVTMDQLVEHPNKEKDMTVTVHYSDGTTWSKVWHGEEFGIIWRDTDGVREGDYFGERYWSYEFPYRCEEVFKRHAFLKSKYGETLS